MTVVNFQSRPCLIVATGLRISRNQRNEAAEMLTLNLHHVICDIEQVEAGYMS